MKTVMGLALAASLLGVSAPVEAACVLTKATEVPLLPIAHHFAVMVKINDVLRPMFVDTGADTVIKDSVVRELGIAPDLNAIAGSKAYIGMGQEHGSVVRRLNALPAVFGVGDVVFHDRSTGVAVLDGDPGVADVAGLVGADFLSQFDVEFDFAAKMLRLYRETGCDAAAPSWDGAFSRIPFRGEAGRIYVDAVFDGVSTSTLVDTGNPVSFILKSAPALAGVSPQSLVDTGSKIDTPMNGGKTFSVLSHVFDDVAVGDDHFRHVKFAVADIPVSHDMANLGLNYWSRHKMWIAYSHHQIFIDKSSPALAVAGVKTVDAASPTTSSSPAVPGVLSGLSVGQLPSERVVHRAVVKDMATWLVALVALDDNCQVVDSAKIVVTKSPDHGAVATESRPRHSEYPVANPRSKCNAVAVPANVVKYTPNAGFTGEDSVTVEMDLASGTHVVEIFALTVD